MTTIERHGSQVVILTDSGELWMTRRVKLRRDSRRRVARSRSVRYKPLFQIHCTLEEFKLKMLIASVTLDNTDNLY
jgi:hypothetical protein